MLSSQAQSTLRKILGRRGSNMRVRNMESNYCGVARCLSSDWAARSSVGGNRETDAQIAAYFGGTACRLACVTHRVTERVRRDRKG
jgi:hypothetical protein